MLWKLLLSALLMSVAIRGIVGTDQRVARQAPDVCSADFVFLVDDSWSISSARFGLAKQFIIDFLQCFTDNEDIGIGVILYNCAPRTGIPLGMYTTTDPVLPVAVSQLMQKGGLSKIGLAIRFMGDTSNFRAGVPRAAILLTDGMAQSDVNAQAMDDYEAQAEVARNAGIDLYGVVIGEPGFQDDHVLENITGIEGRVFPSDNPCNVAYRILANLCESAGAAAGCLYNGITIPVGEEYKPDDCTWCTCPAAGEDPVCAVQDCAPSPCADPVKIAGQCCRVCDAPPGCLYNGAIIPVGVEYRTPDSCTWCNCDADGAEAICASVGCGGSSGCQNYVRYAGQCCPVCAPCCYGCRHGDGIVPSGASFKPNPCSSCSCRGGGMGCGGFRCAPPPCDNPVTLPGECCPICPDVGCEHADGIILAGEDYKVDDCSGCSCSAQGQRSCYGAGCGSLRCDVQVHVAGECCPVCEAEAPEGCPYNGIIIPLHTIYKPDDCTECNCYAAGVAPACVAIFCPPTPCPNPVKIAGRCCRICHEIVPIGDNGPI
ncbi:KCP [Branchiostoma lanceolatum]|uniref:KCP protein n=1 Tax=Branchiostoma lanceolatum TaxID=7740 RepID=A0A8K0ET35_BRALA|nr:KCP [Branchiostoma lanceolatum]